MSLLTRTLNQHFFCGTADAFANYMLCLPSKYLQIAVLLKECQDIQLRCGSILPNVGDGALSTSTSTGVPEVENNIHEHVSMLVRCILFQFHCVGACFNCSILCFR